MNIPDIAEVREKNRRIKEFFDTTGYEAIIIGRQDNFAWYTCGGNNRVVITSESGVTILIITKSAVYAVSQKMDGSRVLDEELKGLDVEPVFLKWFEVSREAKTAEIIKGLRAVSDIPIEGADFKPSEIYRLHYPLSEKEIDKLRFIGSKTESIIRKVADQLKPGMRERDAEAMFLYEYGLCDMTADVLLIGSDERISKYRHPNPSDKKIGHYLLLHPAIRKWGLHANVTRLVYFGDRVPDDIKRKYEAACQIQAEAISMCIPGEKFAEILEAQKRLYAKTGFSDEWQNHFQGGITGYLLADPTLCMNPDAAVSKNQAYDWFITITGVKVEELSINTGSKREVLSAAGHWPVKDYCANGEVFSLPQILLK
jgi:Xaa-Pro aminopeptidase